ncbi:hypothetical protein N0V83_007980 [Neocucurbitaria cava]|uniref:Uncharacterized protein n=1 Tax=Neocucurbitaria cava TaxID=798079 RepID=A0A9W9CJ51_9PLEO|nr:hypothetical protein N0V83_007980 [Neocucurbitaria cava]
MNPRPDSPLEAANSLFTRARLRLAAITPPPPNVSTGTGHPQSAANIQGGSPQTGSVPGSGTAPSNGPPLNASTPPVASRNTLTATAFSRPLTASTRVPISAFANSSKNPSITPTPASKDSSTPVIAEETGTSTKTWTRMKPLGVMETLKRPLRSDILSVPKENEPLFDDEEKWWYLGFCELWEDFPQQVINFYKSEDFLDAIDETKGIPIPAPRRTRLSGNPHPSGLLTDYFQREVLEVAKNIYNRVLQGIEVDEGELPTRISLVDAADEDLGNDDFAWNPDFVVRVTDKGDEETHIIGHAEYLGGKPGALSWAIENMVNNPWGGLRCVLGDMAQWMMMGNIRYAFLTSSDEVIFLKFDVTERVKYVNMSTHGEQPVFDPVDLFKEPWIGFSRPIKFTDVLDEAKGTVPWMIWDHRVCEDNV